MLQEILIVSAPLDAAQKFYHGWSGLVLDSGNARNGCGRLFGPLSFDPRVPIIILGDVIGSCDPIAASGSQPAMTPSSDRSIMGGLRSWRAVASRVVGQNKTWRA
jgi:hypothetical protein